MTDHNQQDNLEFQEDHIVILQDEDGQDVRFEHLMTLEYKGARYILLEAQQDMEDCREGESIILKIEQDEDGDDLYATIEDEVEYEEVFNRCMEAIEEQDAEEADDEE